MLDVLPFAVPCLARGFGWAMEVMSTAPARPLIKSLTLEEVGGRLRALGQPAYRAKQLAQWIYGKRAKSFAEMSDLPAALREQLSNELAFSGLEPIRTLGSRDTTLKYLFRLDDGALIESVLIPASPALYGEASDRRTICISTQVGCAYGCKFCASGLDGWSRNLQPGEIRIQVLRVEESERGEVSTTSPREWASHSRSFENLMQAIIFHHQCPVGHRPRRATHQHFHERRNCARR